MRVAFCIYDFRKEMLTLQPWLTFLRVGQGLVKRGHDVHVITDVTHPAVPDGFTVHNAASLRGTNKTELVEKIRFVSPNTLVFLPTPLNLVTAGWLDALPNCRRVAFASYPYYTRGELLRAWQRLHWTDIKSYLRHLLIPKMIWRLFFLHHFQAVITQSKTTLERLSAALGSRIKLYVIPPGIDLIKWPLRAKAPETSSVRLLYVGEATKIRGFEVLLDALATIKKKSVRLRVLARGSDDAALNQIRSVVISRGLEDRVEVVGGWMQQDDLLSEIHNATAVVLPFVLVPSELPVSVMETIACGTPVIGSRLDGLPSSIGKAGVAAKQADPLSLADVIMRMHDSPGLLKEWYEGCVDQRNQMMDWDTVAAYWEKVLFDED